MALVSISRLTVVELYCLLGRRRRNRDIDARAQQRVVAAFEEDIAQGFFDVHPLQDQQARNLLSRLGHVPLRALDALHLAIATEINAGVVATADIIFAKAATALRLHVGWFGATQQGSGKWSAHRANG